MFYTHASDDGKLLMLAGMRLIVLPDWLGNLTAHTEQDLCSNSKQTAQCRCECGPGSVRTA